MRQQTLVQRAIMATKTYNFMCLYNWCRCILAFVPRYRPEDLSPSSCSNKVDTIWTNNEGIVPFDTCDCTCSCGNRFAIFPRHTIQVTACLNCDHSIVNICSTCWFKFNFTIRAFVIINTLQNIMIDEIDESKYQRRASTYKEQLT